MADDTTSRSQRSGEASWRGTAAFRSGAGPAGGDPLAELARLIGQDNPFSQPAEGRSPGLEPREPSVPPASPARPSAGDWRKIAASMPPYEPLEESKRASTPRELPEALRELSRQAAGVGRDYTPVHSADPAPRLEAVRFDDRRPDEQQYSPPHLTEGERPDARVRFTEDQHRYVQPPFAEDEHEYAQPGFTEGEHPHPQPRFTQDDPVEADVDRERDDEEQYEGKPEDSAEAAYYDEGDRMGPRDEDIYDDPPRSRGRNGLLTALTLIGCAILGTAGAYGYRTYYVPAGASKVPPIITAETTPSKIVPTIDSQPSKSFQDRLGDRGQERVVSREEQPLDLPNPPMPTAPRIVLPAPVAPSQAPAAEPASPVARAGQQITQQTTSSVSPSPPSALGTGIVTEPKRVRTVTIRPDGTDTDGPPISVRPPSPSQTASVRQGSAPKSIAPAPRSAAPLSLDPQANASGSSPATPERVATAPTSIPASPPQTAPAPVTSGGYAVQLSSQRSEAEAQSAFHALQAKYPDLLGNRSPMIRRADLGDKGVYYRSLVGPFATAEEAGRFCSSYKAAGGQCIVQRN
jgi:hypothetical protein